jgi:hypothetical protein
MSVIILLLMLALLGVITWVIVTYIPMPQGIKTVIVIVAVVCAVIYALNAFGVMRLPLMQVPQASATK